MYMYCLHTVSIESPSNGRNWSMDLLEDDEDMRVFAATLSFVDEYNASVSPPTDTPALFSNATPSPPSLHFSNANPSPIAGAPSSSALMEITDTMSQDLIPQDTTQPPKPTGTRQKPSQRRKPQANPNRARNELRFELVYLREKVEQLQTELRALHENPDKKVNLGVLGGSDATVSDSGEVSVWAGVAKRQWGRREEAERENVRLRLIVDRQRKVATDLSNLLRKRVNQQLSHLKDPSITEHRLIRVLDFYGDIGEFQELFRHLDTAYQEVDTVLANGLAAVTDSSDDVHIREGIDGTYLEFCANKVLPFGLRATSEATWDHFRGVGKHFGNGGLYSKAAKNLDQPYTVIEDFTKELHSNTSRADMKAKQIVRRYVEADRDIVVFVSSVTAAEVKHKVIPGMTYHLRGYAVTSRSPASTPENEFSLLQFCSLISLDVEPGTRFNPDSSKDRPLTKFLIGNTVGNIRSYQERIENALVDQALKNRLNGTAV